MSGCQSQAACFIPNTVLPKPEAVSALSEGGQSIRDMVEAVAKGDRAAAERLLSADPRLANHGDGQNLDLLTLAISRCDKPMVELLLANGVNPDGPNGEVPLSLALRANEPWYAAALLGAGASPNPTTDERFWPLTSVIGINSLGAVRLLLDNGADVNYRDRVGISALYSAVAMQNYRIAELLLERGADPWIVTSNGDTIGAAATGSVRPGEAVEIAARERVMAQLSAAGWTFPAPNHAEVRAAVQEGRWPPPQARRH